MSSPSHSRGSSVEGQSQLQVRSLWKGGWPAKKQQRVPPKAYDRRNMPALHSSIIMSFWLLGREHSIRYALTCLRGYPPSPYFNICAGADLKSATHLCASLRWLRAGNIIPRTIRTDSESLLISLSAIPADWSVCT